MVFVSSNNSGSTNEAVNNAHGVCAASTQVSAANSTTINNLSDVVICALFAESTKQVPQLDNKELATCLEFTISTKELATPEQTATGKEISNPLIADSLLKTIRGGLLGIKYSRLNSVSNTVSSASTHVSTGRRVSIVSTVKSACAEGNPQQYLQEKGVIDSGFSRHMTGNMSYLTDFEEIDGGYVAFGGNPKGGKITGRGTIKTGNLDFENVYFVRELKFNLFSVSQMCDKKNSVLFNDIECIVLSPNIKLTDESHVLLKVPRKNNMYSVDLKNIVPKGGLTCLFAKATSDESKLWHMRLGHINFKTMNKLVKGNLVRGLPSKLFEINQTCVACQKGKQHRASFVIDDYSKVSWVFFLATKDETSGILKSFITRIENLIDQRVKVIRCDNGTEFKNKDMNQFCERKADSKLPTTFWAEAVNTACYVQNRVLVTKPHNKNHYELFLGRKLALGFMRPFRYPVTILNTIDHLGKFDGKADEGFFVGYSTNSSGPNWIFDIDALTKSMNYRSVVAGNLSNGNASTKACDDAGKARMETVPDKDYILLSLWPADPLLSQSPKSSPDAGFKPSRDNEKKNDSVNSTNNINTTSDVNNTNNVNAVSSTVNAVGIEVNVVSAKTSIELLDDPNMLELEDIVYSDDYEDVGAEANMNNLNTFIPVGLNPTTRIYKDHPIEQIIKDLNSAPQTRRMTKNLEEHGLISSFQQRTNHKDFQNCLFACFLSQEEPKKVRILQESHKKSQKLGKNEHETERVHKSGNLSSKGQQKSTKLNLGQLTR
ncbi:putative ribonuclease H-like domain-containing protein [Tanacetum coccineum]